MDSRVTPPKQVTSPTWGPPPPCKQALSLSAGWVNFIVWSWYFSVLFQCCFHSTRFVSTSGNSFNCLKKHGATFSLLNIASGLNARVMMNMLAIR